MVGALGSVVNLIPPPSARTPPVVCSEPVNKGKGASANVACPGLLAVVARETLEDPANGYMLNILSSLSPVQACPSAVRE